MAFTFNPVLSEIQSAMGKLSPAAQGAVKMANPALATPATPAPTPPAPGMLLPHPSTDAAPAPSIAMNRPQLMSLPSQAIPPDSGEAPRGTVLGERNAFGDLLKKGSGVSRIDQDIQHSRLGEAHPLAGKLLGGLAEGAARIGDVGLSLASPLAAELTPGTTLNHQVQVNQEGKQVNAATENALKESQASEAGPRADLEEAQAENLKNPNNVIEPTNLGVVGVNPKNLETTPITVNGEPAMPFVKPGNGQHVVLEDPKTGNPIAAVFDPQTRTYSDATTGQPIANPVPFEKQGAEHPTAGTLNGKPTFGVWVQGKGWTDANTGAPMPGFQPPPTFAQTGLWQPTLGSDPKTGQLVPGGFNERTGQFVPSSSTAPSAIPKDVASELGKELQTARESDKRLRIMQQNEASALKGDQQSMLSLVANHIGMTLGAQKGARINQAVWNEAIQSAPWLQNVEKKFGPDGYLQGVTLSPDQIKKMVELGQVVRDQQWKQTEQAFHQYGIPITDQEEQHPNAQPNAGNGNSKADYVFVPGKGLVKQ